MAHNHRPASLWGWRWLCAALLGACMLWPAAGYGAATPIVLYDGALGNMPDNQHWSFFATGGSPTRNPSGGATLLSTSSSKGISAGYFAAQGGFLGSTAAVPTLDRTLGYTLAFSVQIDQEDHSGSDNNGDGKDDRAGFSVIVLSSDKKGIEVGFWKDRIWAQEGGPTKPPLFSQAEGAAFSTSSLTSYQLAVLGDSYTLYSGSKLILQGSLRDYTAFSGFPDPYETPNLLFFGDDTTSASAQIRLASIAVTTGTPITPPPLFPQVYAPMVEG